MNLTAKTKQLIRETAADVAAIDSVTELSNYFTEQRPALYGLVAEQLTKAARAASRQRVNRTVVLEIKVAGAKELLSITKHDHGNRLGSGHAYSVQVLTDTVLFNHPHQLAQDLTSSILTAIENDLGWTCSSR